MPNLDNRECLISCMTGTHMGLKLEKASKLCKDDDRRRSIGSDLEIEKQTHCATYQHVLHYLDEVNYCV